MSSLNDVDRTVDTVQRDVLIAVADRLPASWLVGLLAAFALAARIRRLERATRRIAAGNLATPVTDDGRDEIHELARAFDDMRRRLERTDRARREFIANASHELRTPLFALGGFLELLEDEEDPGGAPRVRRHHARPGVAPDAPRHRPARPVAARCRRRAGGARRGRHRRRGGAHRPGLRRHGRAARQHGRGRRRAVRGGDRRRGARRADRPRAGGQRAPPQPAGRRGDRHGAGDGRIVELVVADNGAADRCRPSAERLFDRFFRGPTGGEGSGLGLAIANELAQRMDGAARARPARRAAGQGLPADAPGGPSSGADYAGA